MTTDRGELELGLPDQRADLSYPAELDEITREAIEAISDISLHNLRETFERAEQVLTSPAVRHYLARSIVAIQRELAHRTEEST